MPLYQHTPSPTNNYLHPLARLADIRVCRHVTAEHIHTVSVFCDLFHVGQQIEGKTREGRGVGGAGNIKDSIDWLDVPQGGDRARKRLTYCCGSLFPPPGACCRSGGSSRLWADLRPPKTGSQDVAVEETRAADRWPPARCLRMPSRSKHNDIYMCAGVDPSMKVPVHETELSHSPECAVLAS